ncbi:MAG: hypothetical protein RIS64_3893 [Bacteroidota bacterium]|jgi:hypothetical protein
MTRFFSLEAHPLKGIIVAFWFGLSFPLCGQTAADIAEMPRRAIGLSKGDSSIARQGLQSIPKDKYGYLAIHGEGSAFKIVEGNTWKTISHKSLAKWIADNRTYDTLTLVLLSCSDTTSTQLLANQLIHYDTTATPKRKPRKIIGWDNEVELYANGYVDGYGFCRLFSPKVASASQNPPAQLLAEALIPHGSKILPDETTDYVVLCKNAPERDFILALTGTQVTTKQTLEPNYLDNLAVDWRKFKVDFVKKYLENSTIIKPTGVAKPIVRLFK